MTVGSTKDLKPASCIWVRRTISGQYKNDDRKRFRRRGLTASYDNAPIEAHLGLRQTTLLFSVVPLYSFTFFCCCPTAANNLKAEIRIEKRLLSGHAGPGAFLAGRQCALDSRHRLDRRSAWPGL